MIKYSWKDIIINPYSEEAKACIGKEVYYGSNPNEVLIRANNNNIFALEKLLKIYPKNKYPFIVDDAYTSHFSCIILKKEEDHKEYVSFKYLDEFLNEYEKHTQKLKPYSIRIKRKLEKPSCRIKLVIGTYTDGITVGKDKYFISWSQLFEDYVFEDDTPCGKLKET